MGKLNPWALLRQIDLLESPPPQFDIVEHSGTVLGAAKAVPTALRLSQSLSQTA